MAEKEKTCRGSILLGTACGKCSRCEAELHEIKSNKVKVESLEKEVALLKAAIDPEYMRASVDDALKEYVLITEEYCVQEDKEELLIAMRDLSECIARSYQYLSDCE